MITSFVLLGASAFGAEIGRESTVGKLQIRTVVSYDDVTVYALGGNLETRAIEVDAILVDSGNQRIVKTKIVKALPSITVPVKISIETDGARVQELRVYELGATMAVTVQP